MPYFPSKKPLSLTNQAASSRRGHTRDLLFVGWSPDGKLLASYSAGDGWIKVWNPQTGKLIWDVKATSLTANSPMKSPDGNLVASGTRGVSYEIRVARSGILIWTIRAHGTSDQGVTNPNGNLIAERGSYGDACVKLFDSKTNRLIRRLKDTQELFTQPLSVRKERSSLREAAIKQSSSGTQRLASC